MLRLLKCISIIGTMFCLLAINQTAFAEKVATGTEFSITPKAYTFLPQLIYPNTTVVAYYTVINNTHIALSGKFSLPNNVILNTNPIYSNQFGPPTCAPNGVNQFSLQANGNKNDNCTLELIVTGPVSNGNVKACLPDGQSCSGTASPLNVALLNTPNYGSWGYAYNLNQAQNRWASNPFIGQLTIWNPVNASPTKRFRCGSNSTAADEFANGNCTINNVVYNSSDSPVFSNSSTDPVIMYVKNWWLGGGQQGTSLGRFIFQLGLDITDKTIQAFRADCTFITVSGDSRLTSISTNKQGALPAVSISGISTSTSTLPISGPNITGTNPIINVVDTNTQQITAIIPYFPTSAGTDTINIDFILNDSSGYYSTRSVSEDGSGSADSLTCTMTPIRPSLSSK